MKKKADQIEEKEDDTVTAPEPDMPKAISGTDGKVTMKKNGVGRRVHVSNIKAFELDGWEFVG